MQRKGIINQMTATFLTAVLIAGGMPMAAFAAAEGVSDTSAAAETEDAETVYTINDFMDWMLEQDDLTEEMELDIKNAQEMYAGYVETEEIVEDDAEDAAAIENVGYSLWILQRIDTLRQSDEYYEQVYGMTDLYTNFTMLVGSAYTANVSIYQVAHVSKYSTFANNEGLAWGYSDPTSGWYTKEKAYITQAMEDLGYSVADLTTTTWSEVTSLASEYASAASSSIGHYTGLFYGVSAGKDTLMGVGYTTESYLYSTTSSYNAAYRTKYSTYKAYTIDEIEEYYYEYLVDIYETEGDCSADQDGSVTWSYDNETKTLTISGTGTMADYTSGTAPWYYVASQIESVVIESGVDNIGAYAFYGCDALSDVAIPSSVTTIGKSAFRGSGLTEITIPATVTSVGTYAFYDCESLTSAVIESSSTSLGSYVFGYCSALTDVALPEGMTTIGSGMFYYCTSMESISIPDTVTSIGTYAFYGCSSLTEIVIPDSVTSISSYAFRGCKSLENAVLGSGVKKIGSYAFQNCTSLLSVTLPDTLSTVSTYAFDGCDALADVYYEGTASSWEANVTVSSGNDPLLNAAFHYVINLAKTTVTVDDADCVYDGTEKEPTVVVTYDGSELTQGTDYSVSYSDNVNAGEASVTITAMGDCIGSNTAVFTIAAASVEAAQITLSESSYEYNGSAKTPDVTVTCGGRELTQGTDYEVSYSDNTLAGTATVTVTGKGNYTGSAQTTFEITECVHTYTTKVVAATCTEGGYTIYTCSKCAESMIADETDALGHDYTDEVTKAATCTEAGEKTYTCNTCGDSYTEEIAALGHSYEETILAEATCTEAGEKSYSCSVCGDSYTEEIAATGHSYEETVLTEATCTEAGEKSYSCSVCGDSYTEEIAATGHAARYTVTETSGSTTTVKTYCSDCGELLGTETTTASGTDDTNTDTSDDTDSSYTVITKSTPANQVSLTNATVSQVTQTLQKVSSDGDLKDSSFSGLKAKAGKVTKKSVKVQWSKVSGAKSYVIYGNKCGASNKYKKLKTVTSTSCNFTKVAGKKVKKGTYYKFLVVALDADGKVISTSKTIHVTTKGGKKTNEKTVKITKAGKTISSVKIKKGKSVKIGTKTTALESSKKLSKHRSVLYESSNTKIATVSKTGKIKAKKKGSCTIYAYAQNGVYAKVKVTVK